MKVRTNFDALAIEGGAPCPQCGHPYDPHLVIYPTPEQIVSTIIPGFTEHAQRFAESDPQYAARAEDAARRFGDGTALLYSECPVTDCRCLITYEVRT